jgi:hypothetical protein
MVLGGSARECLITPFHYDTFCCVHVLEKLAFDAFQQVNVGRGQTCKNNDNKLKPRFCPPGRPDFAISQNQS